MSGQPTSQQSTTQPDTSASPPSTPWVPVLFVGCLILIISFGLRSGFGLFLPEMTAARGWSRELFSLSIAIQNLAWGFAGFFLGTLADRYGSVRVLVLGGVLYATGLVGMAYAETGAMLHVTSGLLVGVAIGGTAFGIVFAALGKIVPEEHRAMAFGFGVAAGSFGQFLFTPVIGMLIDSQGWQNALFMLAGTALLIVLLAFGIRGNPPSADSAVSFNPMQAMRGAIKDRSFHLLFWGYFVCGLQVVFIGLHLPVYIQDQGFTANVGALSLALIGLFNIVGSLTSGYLGQKLPKKWLLVVIYLSRSAVMGLFLLVPISAFSIYVFSAAMGLLWLSTVPLTTALVGQVWGVRYLGMLGGVIFVGHQLGSFMGAWLGGRLYDMFGSYDYAWAMVIAFGLFAAVVHAPIDQRPLASRQQVPQAA